MMVKGKLIRFPFGPSGESEDHTEGSRRLFAYFLVGEKVGPRRERIPTSPTAPRNDNRKRSFSILNQA